MFVVSQIGIEPPAPDVPSRWVRIAPESAEPTQRRSTGPTDSKGGMRRCSRGARQLLPTNCPKRNKSCSGHEGDIRNVEHSRPKRPNADIESPRRCAAKYSIDPIRGAGSDEQAEMSAGSTLIVTVRSRRVSIAL
jgi:hypothetical protein